jgi:RHS repeat-associated protein
LSCDTTANGFTLTRQYILGPNGEQMTEMAVSGGTSTWMHTNVVAGGVIATYLNDNASPHFRLTDWVGTTRLQTNNAGTAELTCQSLPFGDTSAQCAPATEQFYTGYERDTESGNDYAQARHYANSMGRFLSPDPSGLAYADPDNPQSLNLYSYVMNNPLTMVDPTGLYYECTPVTYTPSDANGNPTGAPSTQGPPNCKWIPDKVSYDPNDIDVSLYQPLITPENMMSGQSSGTSNTAAKPAPNSSPKTFWQKNWDCVSNVGYPVLSDDLNPFRLGIGTAADATSKMSQASLEAAASWSVKRGLTVPLRSSIVRAGLGTSEALGRASLILSVVSVDVALIHAIHAEHVGCKF